MSIKFHTYETKEETTEAQLYRFTGKNVKEVKAQKSEKYLKTISPEIREKLERPIGKIVGDNDFIMARTIFPKFSKEFGKSFENSQEKYLDRKHGKVKKGFPRRRNNQND